MTNTAVPKFLIIDGYTQAAREELQAGGAWAIGRTRRFGGGQAGDPSAGGELGRRKLTKLRRERRGRRGSRFYVTVRFIRRLVRGSEGCLM